VKKRIELKEQIYEKKRLMKNKRSEEYEALEEVFDRSTLMTVYDFMNKGEIDEIYGSVKAGKESKVYWGRNSRGEVIAIKIYLTGSAEFKKGMLPYIMGDPRFKHVKKGTRALIYTWARKEFKNLFVAHKSKVRVPKPIAVKKNVLIMEFIGKEGVSAPLIKEVMVKNPLQIYEQILFQLKKLFKNAKLVHGDLSEYNIMFYKRKPVFIDLSQSVSIDHPNSIQFLKRDLYNVNKYFKRLNVDVLSIEELLKRVTGDTIIR
jgi:RIO kinase 1